MKKDNVHDFFHNISRLTIILPILIIAVAIISKPSKPPGASVQSGKYTLTPSPTVDSQPEKPASDSNINLQGPSVCTLDSDTDYSGFIYIKNKNIKTEFQSLKEGVKTTVILKGDCMYKWENEEKTGVKICELSQYVGILETMTKFNLLDAETLLNLMTQFGAANGIENIPEKIPPVSCKKEVINDSLFVIPGGVRFETKTLVKPSPSL